MEENQSCHTAKTAKNDPVDPEAKEKDSTVSEQPGPTSNFADDGSVPFERSAD